MKLMEKVDIGWAERMCDAPHDDLLDALLTGSFDVGSQVAMILRNEILARMAHGFPEPGEDMAMNVEPGPSPCYHPRSCLPCQSTGGPCGLHTTADPAHASCQGA